MAAMFVVSFYKTSRRLCFFPVDYEVTRPLPNVTGAPLARNYAGSMSVNRPGHPNNTLFFWGFEAHNGSLAAPANESNEEPWIIFLNGG